LLLDKIPKEKIRFGKSFESFAAIENGQIKIQFRDDSTTKTDYLIGADGINSTVRKQLFADSQIRYSGQTCWRGVASIELDEKFNNSLYEL